MTPTHWKWATTSRPCPAWTRATIQTPCLILDLDALERNVKKMGDYAKAMGMRHRVHGKMHKSVDVAKLQMEPGRRLRRLLPEGIEAEVFARGGIKDVLVSNQVRDPAKIDRLARMPKLGARTICCVDDVANVADLSAAAVRSTARKSSAWSRSTAARAAAV
jgi:3-hydroxy-D-aspartate aldolase